MKVSRSLKERAALIRIAQSKLISQLGREPTITEIVEETGLTQEDIAAAETATAFIESLQKENGDDGYSLEDVLSDTESEENMVEKIALRQGIGNLPEREATVIRLRYYHGLTQQRVSVILGVSQVQVSRIEKKAIETLRQLLM